MGRKTKAGFDARQYEVLAAVYAKEGTQVSSDMVGGYRTKTTRAGDCLYLDCYPLIGREARAEQETALQELKQSRDRKVQLKYARYNNARRVRAFDQLTETNFGRNDLHVSCTYERDYLDLGKYGRGEYRSREDAKRDMRNYINRIRRLLKRHGCSLDEFRWVVVTVTKECDPESRDPLPHVHHHHILMHGVPEEMRGEVEQLWPFGFCDVDRIHQVGASPSALSGYVARQEGCANGDNHYKGKAFTASRNIIRRNSENGL